MFNDPLTLADASAANKVFKAIGFGPSSTTRAESARTPDQPRIITFSHEKTGAKVNRVIRRLVKVSTTSKDSAGAYHTTSVHVVITAPELYDGETEILDMVAFLKNFLTNTNVSNFLDGEV